MDGCTDMLETVGDHQVGVRGLAKKSGRACCGEELSHCGRGSDCMLSEVKM